MSQLARPQARALGVPLVEAVLDPDFLLPRGTRRRIQAAARDGQQIGLPEQRDKTCFFPLDQCQPLVRGQVRGQIFFEPRQLRGQSANLFVKLSDLLLLGFQGLCLHVLALEDNGQFGDGFLLPLGDQVRVKLMLGSDLGDGLGFFERFQDDLGLESGRILFPHGRWYPP